MDLEERLDEYKTRYRNASLPDDMRQSFQQILAFVDAGMDVELTTDFAGELAGKLQCGLDILFPVGDKDIEDPEELVGEQRYEELEDTLRTYKRLEGDVEEAILNHIPGQGDDTLCLFPAPFQLTSDESPDPGLLGHVIQTLLGEFLHPTLLLRHPPHLPSEDLYDHIVVAGSSLHNLMRLIRCTAGICPEGSTIHVAAVADERFMTSIRDLISESEEFDKSKAELKMEETLHEGMNRKLRQARQRLTEEHDIELISEIHEGTIESLVEESGYFESSPSLLSIPLHFSGGGYDPASLKQLFRRFTSTEILTI